MRDPIAPRVVLLAGGVGGARMAVGLHRVLPAESLTVIVNVGDDDWFHGLCVCPDIDTVMYTLSGQVHGSNAWGVAGDTRRALDVLARLGAADTWMTLGDADLGLHLYRTNRLVAGVGLTEVTAGIARSFGIAESVLPATDDAVSTRIRTDGGELRFQEWFVKHRCAPQVRGLSFEGADSAAPTPQVVQAIQRADFIVIAPSNPWLSILPMLRIAGIERAIMASTARKIAVSPLIAGRAVKGPLTDLMRQLGVPAGNDGIAHFYKRLVDAIAIDSDDRADAPRLESHGLQVLCGSTRIGVAEAAGALATQLLAWSSAQTHRKAS
jgi:LPPG:FO 2-phospho-L-lactate transferase